MKVSDYTYELPEELIALFPPEKRGQSRLLALERKSGRIGHRTYTDAADYLKAGDVVVLNNTKVIKARLIATNASGQRRELLLLEDHHNKVFTRRKVLYRGRIRSGETLTTQGHSLYVESVLEDGLAQISSKENILELANLTGTVPLPPYMRRDATAQDVKRYQTVFAEKPGSVAAPTASLNFTHELEQALTQKGIHIAYLTLHVGLGTFLPIRSDDLQKHVMHSEYFEIPAPTIRLLKSARINGSKIVAVGTTVARSLEFAADQIMNESVRTIAGEANIFIYPGYKFKLVDALLTNFHAPHPDNRG